MTQEVAQATEAPQDDTQGAAVNAPATEATTAPDTQAEVGKTKTFTQDEVDAIVEKRLARKERATERELADRVAREVQAAMSRQAKPEPAPVSDEAPKRDQFDDYEQYIEARAEWRARDIVKQQFDAREKAEKEAKEKATRAEALQKFDERKSAAAAKYEDFEDALEVARKLPITDAMFEAMVNAPEGWDIAHHFGTNPSEAQRIAALPPYAQAAEIGKLAVMLSAQTPKQAEAPTPKTALVSKAPEPIVPVGGKSVVASDEPSDKDSPEVWARKRQAQLAKQARRA